MSHISFFVLCTTITSLGICPLLTGCTGLLMGGAHSLNYSDLNNDLASKGYGKLETQTKGQKPANTTSVQTVGLAFIGITPNAIYGLQGQGFLQKYTNAPTDSFSANLSGVWGSLFFGPKVSLGKNFMLVPNVGLGGGSLNLGIEKSTSINSILESSTKTTADTTTKMPSADLHSNFSITTTQIDLFLFPCDRGLTWGLHAGYLNSPSDNSWRDEKNVRVNELSPVKMSGQFYSVSVGYGNLCDNVNAAHKDTPTKTPAK